LAPQRAVAYFVLAHESMVDSAWDHVIVPMLRARFRGADGATITNARAFASTRGEYTLADETYAELLERLTSKMPTTVPDALRAEILRFYGTVDVLKARDKKERRELEKIEKELAILRFNHEEPKNTKQLISSFEFTRT
jgi:hypothetical protein